MKLLHLPLLTPFGGKKTRGFLSFVYNLIRLILVCVQESLIMQKSYYTSLMIQILSCVPAFRRHEYHLMWKSCWTPLYVNKTWTLQNKCVILCNAGFTWKPFSIRSSLVWYVSETNLCSDVNNKTFLETLQKSELPSHEVVMRFRSWIVSQTYSYYR